jgi:hypothetical protein
MNYYILGTIIILYIIMYNKYDSIEEYFNMPMGLLKDMKNKLLYFHKEGYKDYKYLHYDANVLVFLYDSRKYEKIAPFIYKDLVIKTIKYMKLINTEIIIDSEKNILITEILNIFHSFIFNLKDNELDSFMNENNYFEKILKRSLIIKDLNNYGIGKERDFF